METIAKIQEFMQKSNVSKEDLISLNKDFTDNFIPFIIDILNKTDNYSELYQAINSIIKGIDIVGSQHMNVFTTSRLQFSIILSNLEAKIEEQISTPSYKNQYLQLPTELLEKFFNEKMNSLLPLLLSLDGDKEEDKEEKVKIIE